MMMTSASSSDMHSMSLSGLFANSFKESVSANINLGTGSSLCEITFVMTIPLELVSRPINMENIRYASKVFCVQGEHVGHSCDLLFLCLVGIQKTMLVLTLAYVGCQSLVNPGHSGNMHISLLMPIVPFSHCSSFAYCIF